MQHLSLSDIKSLCEREPNFDDMICSLRAISKQPKKMFKETKEVVALARKFNDEVVRPCVVYGPHTDNYLSRFLANLPVIFLADGRDPDFQFVHEEDLAQLFSLLIERKIPGAFNAAGDGVVTISEAGVMIGKKR